MIACESFFRFTLPEGSRHHEDVNPNSSTGVDFEVAGDPPIWMEVKNWESPTIPDTYRETQRQSFADEMANDDFWSGIVRKFEGTHDRLSERNERPPEPTLLLLLHCDRYTRGQVAPDTSILERKIARSAKVADGRPAVLPFASFASFVTGASTSPCALVDARDPACGDPVPYCSWQRIKHR